MTFIELLFKTAIDFASFLVRLILLPIDALITSLLPDLSSAFTAVGDYLSAAMTNIGWVLSFTGIPPATIALLVTFLTFKLTLPIQVWVIKLAVGWYHKLKP